MPISGAPSASARLHFGFVMHFDQRLHAEARRFVDHRSRGRVVEQRQHDEHRVGARDPRFADLPDIDEEILGQDRPVELAPGGGEVVERTTEIGTIAKDAERVRDAGIAAGQCGWIDRRADRSCRRRGALDFEDEARAHPAPARRRGCAASARHEREAVERNAVVTGASAPCASPPQSRRAPRFSHGSPRRSRRAPAAAPPDAAHRARDSAASLQTGGHCRRHQQRRGVEDDDVAPRRATPIRRAAPSAAPHSRRRRRRSPHSAARARGPRPRG